ncbi:hypothetical protein [Paraburkholderia ribeironis]|nr:hypothetical protein [Paraburkholderia ribeironis]
MGSPASASVAAASGAATASPLARSPSAASQPAAQPVSAPATPHLSIDDIDQITRLQIARQLGGNGGQQGSSVAPASAPAPAPVVRATSASSRAEPVRFVGAFSDMHGTSVLYEYRNAAYPAHVGAKLLNGWTVKRVDGFVVTVADGRRIWTETISGGTANTPDNPQASGIPARALNDLGGPLPAGTPLSAMGN